MTRNEKYNPPPKTAQTTVCDLDHILGPAISKQSALAAIHADAAASRIFSGFPPDEQEKLIGFIQGAQGLKITYDNFFRHILNPNIHPKRLESFLSAVLCQNASVKAVLPSEGVRMTDGGSLVIMDIVVELTDGAIVNIEIQKIGYLFPGQRADCYAADFIMRQYNRVRAERRKHFSFRDLKPVILIIIMEKSPKEFLLAAPKYIHRSSTVYDSGICTASLSKKIFISLDIFRSSVHNKNTKLDAWLTFLSSDHPADILRLVSSFPEFLSCYQDLAEFRRNPKELIFMYSKALAILDRNTERIMYEEMLNDVRSEMTAQIVEKDAAIALRDTVIAEKDSAIAEKDSAIKTALEKIDMLSASMALLQKQIDELTSRQ